MWLEVKKLFGRFNFCDVLDIRDRINLYVVMVKLLSILMREFRFYYND